MSSFSPLTSTLSTLTLAESDSDLKGKEKAKIGQPSSNLPMPSNLHTLLPDAKTPWNISSALQKRFDVLPNSDKYKKVEVKEGDFEWKFVQAYFQDQCPENRIIQKIYCVRKYNLTQSFEAEILTMEEKAVSPVFAPSWDKEESVTLREQAIRRWQALTAPFSPFSIRIDGERVKTIIQTKILPLWHGTSAPVCDSIAQTGFTFFGKYGYKQGEKSGSTDIGYFGSGIYFTNSARYAAEIYSTGHLLLAWVSMREPYPVVADCAVTPPLKSKDMEMLEGRGAYKNYNAHYIPVISVDPKNKHCAVYYPCADGQVAAWDELVVFQSSQTLPRFWVELAVALPKAPSSSSPPTSSTVKETVDTLLTKILDLLENSAVKQDATLTKLLESHSEVLIALKPTDPLNPSQQSLYQWTNKLMDEQGKVRQFVAKKMGELSSPAIAPMSLPSPSITAPPSATAIPKELKAPASLPSVELLFPPLKAEEATPKILSPVPSKEIAVPSQKAESQGKELKLTAALTLQPKAIETVGVLTGHTDAVSSLAVAGEFLCSGSSDKTIRVWDLKTGKHLSTLKGHTDEVSSLAVSGDIFCSGSYDKTIRTWELNGNHLLTILIDTSWLGTILRVGCVHSLAASGRYLFAGFQGGKIRMFELATGKLIDTLNETSTNSVYSLAVAEGYLFSGSVGGLVQVWKIETGKQVHTLKGHDTFVSSLAVAGKYLFSGSCDKTIRMWEIETGKHIRTLTGHTSQVRSLIVAGKYLFSGSCDKTIRLWEIETGKHLHTLTGHTGTVYSLAIAEGYLFSGSDDTTIRVWNLFDTELSSET